MSETIALATSRFRRFGPDFLRCNRSYSTWAHTMQVRFTPSGVTAAFRNPTKMGILAPKRPFHGGLTHRQVMGTVGRLANENANWECNWFVPLLGNRDGRLSEGWCGIRRRQASINLDHHTAAASDDPVGFLFIFTLGSWAGIASPQK